MTLTEVPTTTILQSLSLRAKQDPLRFFRPNSPEQDLAFRKAGKGLLVIGGNRSGKTQIGAVRCVCKAIGKTLHGVAFKRAKLIWCVSQELPGQNAKDGDPAKPHTQLEAIQRWIPQDALHGGSWASAYSPGAYTLRLANGTKILFKSYDQGLLAFESAAVDHIWYDEEPTAKAIFSSCLLRLVDRRGTWDMTLTPVHSLQGKSIIAEDLWEQRFKAADGGSPYGQYYTVQLHTLKNVHLPAEEVASLENLPEQEKIVRLQGGFARLGGRVLSEYDPGRHLVEPFLPPRSWRHYLVIDPGYANAFAGLWAAVDRNGRIWLYDEYYEAHKRPDDHLPALHYQWQCHGSPEVEVIMDAAAWALNRTAVGKESPSDYDELVAAAEQIGATWFQPRKCKKADPHAYRVKRYLSADLLKVQRHLEKWQWECERWTYPKASEGPRAGEQEAAEAPIRAFSHLMDTTRYLCNELPDPISDPEPPVPLTIEREIAAMRGKKASPAGSMGSEW